MHQTLNTSEAQYDLSEHHFRIRSKEKEEKKRLTRMNENIFHLPPALSMPLLLMYAFCLSKWFYRQVPWDI